MTTSAPSERQQQATWEVVDAAHRVLEGAGRIAGTDGYSGMLRVVDDRDLAALRAALASHTLAHLPSVPARAPASA